MTTILTEDNQEIQIPQEYIAHLNTVQNMVNDVGDGVIPIPITSNQWKVMETYLNIYLNELPVDAEKVLADKSNDELCDLLQTANHMDFSVLITNITDILATRVENLKPEEIRKIFMVDYQPVETNLQNEIQDKLRWYHQQPPEESKEPDEFKNTENPENPEEQSSEESPPHDPYEWMNY